MTTIMYDDDGNMMDETIGNLFAQPIGKPTGPIPPSAPPPMDFDQTREADNRACVVLQPHSR